MEGTLAVLRDDGPSTQRRVPSRRAQCGAARSCAELRQRIGAGPDADCAPDGRLDGPGRWRLSVARAWKEASRTHFFEAHASLLGLRRSFVGLVHKGR